MLDEGGDVRRHHERHDGPQTAAISALFLGAGFYLGFIGVLMSFIAAVVARKDLRRAVIWMLLPELVLLPAMFLLIETGSMWLAVLGMAVATAGVGLVMRRVR